MCVSGKPIAAAEALQAGLIDAVIEGDLAEGAVRFAQQAGPPVKTRDRAGLLGTVESNAPLYAAGRDMAAKIRRHQQAPLRAVEAIEGATALPFDQGCARERKLFEECIASDQAKSLIHAFFAERTAAKVPGVAKAAASPVARVAIIGAGTMGGGIAMTCANAGLDVLL
jgi:3-hydroxyacyl-CoA dehydrogenase